MYEFIRHPFSGTCSCSYTFSKFHDRKHRRMKKILFWCIMVFFSGISSGRDIEDVVFADPLNPTEAYPFDDLYSPWVDSVFNSLTPDQRIGQLFFAAAYSNLGKKHVETITDYINKYQIGGLIFFQGGPKRQLLLTNQYQAISRTPLLIGIDAEWGLGMRLDSSVSFPRQMALGAIEDVNLLYRMGNELGLQCRRMGIHLNFAPVADVNNNPVNPVIGTRSFGENSRDVAQRDLMYMLGMQRQHILTAAKHFPGHGNTAVDSHYALPVVTDSYAALDSLEWYPYKEMIKHHLTGVLAAHINVPDLDATPGLAASLSHRVLTDILRDSLGFKGLVYTDALNMKGVSKYFKPGELEVKALEAGADVLLMPADISKALAAIKAAIDSGRIDRKQIELSCRRILAAKEWAGLNTYFPVDTAKLSEYLNSPEVDLLNRQLVEASLTVVQNRDSILPLKRLDKEKTAILIAGTSSPNNFLRTLSLYQENDYFFFDKNTLPSQAAALLEKLRVYSRVIVGIHNTNSNPGKSYGILPGVASLVDQLAEHTNVILCVFAPPYSLSSFRNKEKTAAIVVSYQETPLFQDYTAQLLYGAITGTGKLPVSVDSTYRYRQGIRTVGGIRFKYSIPEEAGVFSYKLTPIDTMVQNAIKAHAMPGCQILAARNGIVFFKKEYGQTRYDSEAEPVDPRHIYDLASVTKVTATLPSVMLLYDRGQIKMRDKLAGYLPDMKGSDKDQINMIDLLTHQSGLQPSVGLYLSTMTPIDSTKRLLARSADALYSIRLGPATFLNSQTRFKDDYYSISEDGKHQLQVADGMYVVSSYRDTIFNNIRKSKLLKKKQYKYSDLGFILLGRISERLSGQPLEDLVTQQFYDRLGASTLGYLPAKHFLPGRIVPTSHDTIFRHQWLQGYVHDENAALMGGVSGHAGVFGNANDLAKLMQMYLNKGEYGGERYIKKETIEYFTSCPFCKEGNRRGVGFDKPEINPGPQNVLGKNASKKSFGHTGFTGTMVWMDPENGLLYVFLSNRVFPDSTNNKLITSNLRVRIYEVLAHAINTEK